MGRTLATLNEIVLTLLADFNNFRRTLRAELQPHYDTLWAYVRRNVAAISMAPHVLPFEAALLAMLVETTREIDELKEVTAVQEQDIAQLRELVLAQAREIERLQQPTSDG